MERLTNTAWRNFDPWECCGQDHYCTRGCHDDGGCNNGCIVPKLYSRLAAYEDFMDRWHLKSIEDAERIFRRVNDLGGTDLMAQYRELGSINHLRDLLRAEKSGQLVVLPCKVGDTVYVTGECRIMECFIDEAYLDDRKGIEYLVSFDCDNNCEGCPFNDWHQEDSGEYSCNGEWDQASIKGSDIGKTVFLAREEAEAALAGKGGSE